MSRASRAVRFAFVLASIPAVFAPPARAQGPVGTAFTYQGRLTDESGPANASYDMEFKLFDVPGGGIALGTVLGTGGANPVVVAAGLFTARLDFGAAFTGSKLWLEIGVKPAGFAGAYTLISPRQELTPTPNALYAGNAATIGGIACTLDQIPKWNGTAWACASDNASGGGTVTTVTASAPLSSTGGASPDISLIGGATGEVLASPGGVPAWTGSPSLSGNLALANTSGIGVGVVTKGGNPFLHNYGVGNTFIGENAGNFSMSGGSNTAVGRNALQSNLTSAGNTATGFNALGLNTTGGSNTAIGTRALENNDVGFSNTAAGTLALRSNTSGDNNAVMGSNALRFNTSGSRNLAVGSLALFQNTTGSNNIAVGQLAGSSLTTGSFNIAIGHAGGFGETNTTWIGDANQTRAFISGIFGVTPGSDRLPVVIDGNGQLGTAASSTPENFSGNLAGEVTGPQGATVVSGAVSANTAGAIVRRDVGGDFEARSTTLSGNINLVNNTGLAAGGNIMKGGQLFIHNSGGTFIGENAGNLNMGGFGNTASGRNALRSNTDGQGNTAAGELALTANSSGHRNTAVGGGALQGNTSGGNNTAVGWEANVSSGDLTSATAIGAYALVSRSNSLVLGGSDINVGIGTSAPDFTVHVVGENVRVQGLHSGKKPRFSLFHPGGGPDHGKWQNFAWFDGLVFTALNDAEDAETRWLEVTRGPGTNIQSVSFPNGRVSIGAGPSFDKLAVNGTISLATLGSVGATALCRNAANQISICESLASLTLPGNITLDASSATAGNILKGGTPFIHNFGSNNTFMGVEAGNLNPALTGARNTALGRSALKLITTGDDNTASGHLALTNNMSGVGNTANGSEALRSNTSGTSNTGLGGGALFSNTSGGGNTAVGSSAMYLNTGNNNTAVGNAASYYNTIGNGNTAIGAVALFQATTGSFNTAVGDSALIGNTTGTGNIALGRDAGSNLTTGDRNIDIGHVGVAGEASTIRIGTSGTHTAAYFAGISGQLSTGGVAVFVNSQGKLGTTTSSRRFKDDIADMGPSSSDLMKLRPVTFLYKAEQGPAGRTLQYGLIAEEVAEVYPGLVAHSADGQIETVMYQFLPAMLLNEYQKQERTIQAQQAAIQRQTARLADLEQSRRELTEELVSLKAQVGRIAELEAQAARVADLLKALAPKLAAAASASEIR